MLMYCDLWPLAFDLWIVDRSTARDFTVYNLKQKNGKGAKGKCRALDLQSRYVNRKPYIRLTFPYSLMSAVQRCDQRKNITTWRFPLSRQPRYIFGRQDRHSASQITAVPLLPLHLLLPRYICKIQEDNSLAGLTSRGSSVSVWTLMIRSARLPKYCTH